MNGKVGVEITSDACDQRNLTAKPGGTDRLIGSFSAEGNGRIKDYQIQVSNDGKTWGDVLVKGSFENNVKEKRVMFSKPVKARYVRFTALSSQDGQDFAPGAEMGVLAE